MKKRKISILLLLAALISGFSAEAKVLGLSFGPKAGVNISKFDLNKGLENIMDANNRCGFTIGGTAEYIAPVLGLGVDLSLMYSYQAGEVETEFSDVPGTSETFTKKTCGSFFEIPLHIKYKLSLPAISSYLSPYVFTGPSVAFKLSGDKSYFNTKSIQWGWDLGLGVELFKHLQVGAGYTFGINNIAKKLSFMNELGEIEDVKIKNNYWTVTAAWMF